LVLENPVVLFALGSLGLQRLQLGLEARYNMGLGGPELRLHQFLLFLQHCPAALADLEVLENPVVLFALGSLGFQLLQLGLEARYNMGLGGPELRLHQFLQFLQHCPAVLGILGFL
jgi:hypothetical protein